MKRLLLFSHFNKYGYLSEHVIFLLEALQKYYDDTVIISNSPLVAEDKDRLKRLSTRIVERPNRGYDFSAWHDAMVDIGREKLAKYDSVTIMNDTCFGPIYSFDPVFESLEKERNDFWGLVAHRKLSRIVSPSGVEIPRHLQSFFVTFNKNVVKSDVFWNFWSNVVEIDDVHEVILRYETQLTKQLVSAGFKYDAFFDSDKVEAPGIKSDASAANFTIYSPEKCLEARMPLVKIKAFTHHEYPRYLVDKIRTSSNYPAQIIENYFSEYSEPNQQLLIMDKLICDVLETKKLVPRIAVHLHAFYMDVAEEFISKFKKWPFSFDLYVTVSNDQLKRDIQSILREQGVKAKKIVVLANRGYAVIPWITVANEYLWEYDVVGHFHTKKDAHMDEWVGKVWTDDLKKMLVDDAPKIIKTFSSNNKIGIVIPDIPRHARHLGVEMYYGAGGLREIVTNLYDRMERSGPKSVKIDEMLAYIYPYGMMYWYRPNALKPITDLVFSEAEVPYGKLPDTTVLHAIERLFVYVSWVQGYDFRISPLHDYTSEFIPTLAVNKQSYLRERSAPVLTIGVKGALKNKIKREMIRSAKKMPPPVRIQLLRLHAQFVAKRNASNDTIPAIKLFTHELSNTGGPRVAIDLFEELRKSLAVKSMGEPALLVPDGSRVDNVLEKELRQKNIFIEKFRPETLIFSYGDIVIMNTFAYTEHVFTVVLTNLEQGIIRHVYLYPHEYVVESYLSPMIVTRISKLIKQKKLTIFASATKAKGVYEKHFNTQDIHLMPNRIDIAKNVMFARGKDDFETIRFIMVGTPDARKGGLDILYAFMSFYINAYKGNTEKYRNFTLTLVGLTNNTRDVYNKLYSDRLRIASKVLGEHVVLYDQQPEEKTLEIIKSSNLTILYSLYENLPRVVFDGLAYGHPVLRNDCSGYEEQLEDRVNGWKISTDNWEGFVNTIETVLNKKKTSNAELAKMSEESYKIAKRYATINYRVIDDIKDLLKAEDRNK